MDEKVVDQYVEINKLATIPKTVDFIAKPLNACQIIFTTDIEPDL
ncbi:hypothetical protein HMPREF0496_1331 [Lentilactobacillus hilgardii ATCC 27305]|nr:hypothetical protein HMPREF0496_1331 [Lentilactobacillus hilgardii ATCC 27305]